MSEVSQISGFNNISGALADAILSAKGGIFCKNSQNLAHSAAGLMSADLFGLYLLDDFMHPSGTLLSQPMDGFLWEYEEFRSKDPVFLHLLREKRATDGVSLLGQEAWARHPLTLFLDTWGLYYSLQGGIHLNGRIVATINFARSKHVGPFNLEQRLKLDNICKQISDQLAAERSKDNVAWPIDQAVDLRDASWRNAEAILLTDETGILSSFEAQQEATRSAIGLRNIQKAITENIELLNHITHGNMAETEIVLGKGPSYSLTTLPVPGAKNFISFLMPENHQTGPLYDPLSHFGKRTRTVLDLLVRGYPNKLIARQMGISENTVKDHIRRIYLHFGARSRAELGWVLHGKM